MKMQIKNLRAFGLMLLAALAITFTSCNQDLDLTDVDNFTDSAVDGLQRGVVGKNHCLEFIFPVTIAFVDESTASVESYENLHETVSAWFESNDVEKSRENKPELVFPVQVVNQEGEVIDVEDDEALRALKSECPREGRGDKGRGGKGYKCFSLVFPVSLDIAGEITSFEDHETFKSAIRAYKEEFGRDADRPELVFPVTVEYDDGTQVEVASQEEMQALKEDCKER